MKFRGEHLLRVVVLDDTARLRHVRVQAVELYEDGVVVRWRLCGSSPVLWPNALAPTEDAPELSLVDDVGTRYTLVGTASGGDRETYRGESEFVPRAAPVARQLRVLGLGDAVAVRLDRDNGQAAAQRE
jgi:hypothetical protein